MSNVLENSVLLGALATENTLKVIGLVSDVMGAKGTITVSLDNLRREGVAVRTTITDSTGKVYNVICSKQVSEGIRDKSIKLNQVATFPITEYETREGTIIPKIVLPLGSSVIVGVESKSISTVPYVRATEDNILDFVAL
jgi:hypothetical protein